MPPTSRRTILLVEDEAVIAMDLRRQLEEVGFEVVASVSKSEDVVPAVQRYQPAIVLMDVRLKGDVDGIALAEEIFVCEDIPVVFLSAYADLDVYERAGRAGGYGYLTKPVRQAALVATLEMALQKHHDLQSRRDDAQWLGVMINALDAAIVGLDPAGCVRFMNHAATQLTGWLLMDAKGECPPWAEQLTSIAPCVFDGATSLSLAIRADHPLPVQVKKLMLKAGGSVCIIASSADIH